ncbi:hypothetical protein ACVHNB_18865 [Streptomyces sp. YJ-C3]
MLLDELDGGLADLLNMKWTLSAPAGDAAVARYLDAYVNQAYRTLPLVRPPALLTLAPLPEGQDTRSAEGCCTTLLRWVRS